MSSCQRAFGAVLRGSRQGLQWAQLQPPARQIGVIVSRSEKTPSGRNIQDIGYAIPAKTVLDFVRQSSK